MFVTDSCISYPTMGFSNNKYSEYKWESSTKSPLYSKNPIIIFEGKIREEEYKQLITTTKQSLSILPKTLDNWIKVRKLWTDNVCTDGSRGILGRNTSEVIIRLSNIISHSID